MLSWKITPIRLPLRYTWRISRNTSTHKINFIIECRHSRWKGLGETAPNIRYGETTEAIQEDFERFIRAGADRLNDLDELTALLDSLELKNALRFGIESAYIHMLCHAEQVPVQQFLHVPPVSSVRTSYTMPILDPGEVKAFYEKNNLKRFSIMKLKLNADNGPELLSNFFSFSRQPVIIDPNEAFPDADSLLRFLHSIRDYNVLLVEQPMPVACKEDYKAVKKAGLLPVMADESICEKADFTELKEQFDCVNMKLMKAGGYLNGIRILNEARSHGMKTMIGCMVETTLGISAALNLCGCVDYADLDGFMIVEDEPMGLLKEENGVVSFNTP